METRKDLRKHNQRNNLYLIIAGIVIILVVIFGIVFHNQHTAADAQARKFAANHFNSNVTIYGIQVGKLTVNKATAKINQLADNTVRLTNDKVISRHDPNVKTITKARVAQYFQKQHTAAPNKQVYTYNASEFTAAKKKLEGIHNATLTYQIAGKNFKLQGKNLIQQATYKNGKLKIEKAQPLTKKIKQIDHQVATLHKSYQFSVPVDNTVKGQTINVQNKTYGWGIATAKTKKAIEKALINGKKTVNGKNYLYGLGYNTYAHGYQMSNHNIGENYIVVSIKKQEIWVIRHGKLAVRLDDVVTGTYNGGKGNRTPTGVWYIMYKQSPSVLRGQNDDGSSYASPVKYWMPFTLSGCGFHDASWRSDWSKTAYLNGGSHGCVNVPPSQIHSVWEHVLQDEAVVIYN